jgi:hypothetical protein
MNETTKKNSILAKQRLLLVMLCAIVAGMSFGIYFGYAATSSAKAPGNESLAAIIPNQHSYNHARYIELPRGYKFRDVRATGTDIVVVSRPAEIDDIPENTYLSIVPNVTEQEYIYTVIVVESGFDTMSTEMP